MAEKFGFNIFKDGNEIESEQIIDDDEEFDEDFDDEESEKEEL